MMLYWLYTSLTHCMIVNLEVARCKQTWPNRSRWCYETDTQNWIASAEYDLATAQHMLTTGRFLYVIFCCHIALEKILKAHVTAVTESFAPKTHDLIFLIKKSGLVLPLPLLDFISKINNASIPTRYPEDLSRALMDYPESVA